MKRHGFIATALVALSLAVMALPVAAIAESADVDESFALYAASSSCPGNNGGKHSLKVATKEATCTEAGEKYIYCTLCDTVHETLSTTPALDHDFSVAVNEVPATCTTDGSTGGWKCSRCDATKGVEPIKATGHSFGDWETTQEATCTTAGVKTRAPAAPQPRPRTSPPWVTTGPRRTAPITSAPAAARRLTTTSRTASAWTAATRSPAPAAPAPPEAATAVPPMGWTPCPRPGT